MKRDDGFSQSQFALLQPTVVMNCTVASAVARLTATAVSLLILTVPVSAQSPGQRIIVEQSPGASRQEGFVRVQSNINLFMPGPTDDGEEAQKLRERARRIVYEMAAHECDVLRDVLAKDCRLESINSNIGRQFGQQQQEGFNVSGSMSLQVTLK